MIIWEEIDTVLLDMDGTLLDLHFDNYFWHEYLPRKWGELHDLDVAGARERLMPDFYSLAGTLPWYCLDHWSERLGMDILTLKEDIEHLIRVRPSALELLAFVSRAGKRMALVTNAHQGLIEMKFRRTGLGDYLKEVFCAHHLGYPKEDPMFWTRLHEVYPFDPGRTLLIDDNLSVLESARGHGIRHLYTIAQPDSSKPRRECGDFTAIESFLDCLTGSSTDPRP